jgi:hypothetical protein
LVVFGSEARHVRVIVGREDLMDVGAACNVVGHRQEDAHVAIVHDRHVKALNMGVKGRGAGSHVIDVTVAWPRYSSSTNKQVH